MTITNVAANNHARLRPEPAAGRGRLDRTGPATTPHAGSRPALPAPAPPHGTSGRHHPMTLTAPMTTVGTAVWRQTRWLATGPSSENRLIGTELLASPTEGTTR